MAENRGIVRLSLSLKLEGTARSYRTVHVSSRLVIGQASSRVCVGHVARRCPLRNSPITSEFLLKHLDTIPINISYSTELKTVARRRRESEHTTLTSAP